jgi:hypothetical protein
MQARIFQAGKTATQSGRAGAQSWVLEYEPGQARRIDPLTGWTGGGDTTSQIRLVFPTREQALACAQRLGLEAIVEAAPMSAPRRLQSYADNFRTNRIGVWTH